MKKVVSFLICALSFVHVSLSQERLDSLFYLNGKVEAVSIVKNSSNAIDCTYVGEDMISSIEKSKLNKIVFKSGRVEICNEVKELKYDKLHFANGNVIEAKVTKLSDDSIEYVLPNEDMSNIVYKTLLHRIEFSNGRVEEYGNLLNIKVITSKDQWKEVVVTYSETDTRGLEKVKEISKASGWGGALASGAGYNDAIKLCQKEAAKLGCGLILINGSPNARNTHHGAGVRVNATAYRLPKKK